jgi:glutamate synthase domain-containing protein 2
MEIKEIKQMLDDRELTTRGAVRLCLEAGLRTPDEVIKALGIGRASFYTGVKPLREAGKVKATSKNIEYSLEK